MSFWAIFLLAVVTGEEEARRPALTGTSAGEGPASLSLRRATAGTTLAATVGTSLAALVGTSQRVPPVPAPWRGIAGRHRGRTVPSEPEDSPPSLEERRPSRPLRLQDCGGLPEACQEAPMRAAIPHSTVTRTGGTTYNNKHCCTPAATAMGALRPACTMGVAGRMDDILLGMIVPSPEVVEEAPLMGMADGPMTMPQLVATEATIFRRMADILRVEAQEALGMSIEVRAALQMETRTPIQGMADTATPTVEVLTVMGLMTRADLQEVEDPTLAMVAALGQMTLQAIHPAVLIPPARALGGQRRPGSQEKGEGRDQDRTIAEIGSGVQILDPYRVLRGLDGRL